MIASHNNREKTKMNSIDMRLRMYNCNQWFPSIPASDYLTGKKRNKFEDVLKYYQDDVGEGEVVIFVLRSRDGNGVGSYHASFGTAEGIRPADRVLREHTQTAGKSEHVVQNIVVIDSTGVVFAENDIGLKAKDASRPLWVMK